MLFLDLVSFTQLASSVSAAELIDIVSTVFGALDRITVHCGLLKIKTLGDGYMATCGIPDWRGDHVDACLRAAAMFNKTLEQYAAVSRHGLKARVGINSGPLVSGVIGATQLTFDVWGDTVNVASRLEQSAPVGGVCISATTKRILETTSAQQYAFTSLGRKPVKGKGEMELFSVELPALSAHDLRALNGAVDES